MSYIGKSYTDRNGSIWVVERVLGKGLPKTKHVGDTLYLAKRPGDPDSRDVISSNQLRLLEAIGELK